MGLRLVRLLFLLLIKTARGISASGGHSLKEKGEIPKTVFH